MNAKERLLNTLNDLRKDFNVLTNPDGLQTKYDKWISEVETEKIKNKELISFIQKIIDHYQPKDRKYAKELERLIRSDQYENK